MSDVGGCLLNDARECLARVPIACLCDQLPPLERRDLIVRLHVRGILSEGQAATATGLDRVTIRKLADEVNR